MCPWDRVDIWVTRTPEGEYRFTAYVADNQKFGFPSLFANGATPEEAVNEIAVKSASRDPHLAIEAAIREMEEKITKLKETVIGLPPYKPNRELVIKVPSTVDV